jgi:uncharacterized membrane protein YfhO
MDKYDTTSFNFDDGTFVNVNPLLELTLLPSLSSFLTLRDLAHLRITMSAYLILSTVSI